MSFVDTKVKYEQPFGTQIDTKTTHEQPFAPQFDTKAKHEQPFPTQSFPPSLDILLADDPHRRACVITVDGELPSLAEVENAILQASGLAREEVLISRYWPQHFIVYFSDITTMSRTAALLLHLEAPLYNLSAKPWSILDGGGQTSLPYNVHMEVEFTGVQQATTQQIMAP
jgi:hypothetical protein